MSSFWVYHPDHESKIVGEYEYEKLMSEGWYSNPGHFPKETKEEVPEIKAQEETAFNELDSSVINKEYQAGKEVKKQARKERL